MSSEEYITVTVEFVGIIAQSLILKFIVLGWVLKYQNWAITLCEDWRNNLWLHQWSFPPPGLNLCVIVAKYYIYTASRRGEEYIWEASFKKKKKK